MYPFQSGNAKREVIRGAHQTGTRGRLTKRKGGNKIRKLLVGYSLKLNWLSLDFTFIPRGIPRLMFWLLI